VRPLTYSQHAQDYDRLTKAFTDVRRAIVEALPLGEVVLDVGCGTGLCFPMLLDKVGRHGHIVGIDASPHMLAVARDRVAQHGWCNITLVQSPIDQAPIPVTADAALFCAVHDVLRSPPALRRVVDSLRPAAWVAAGGGKWAPPWMTPLNMQVQMLHAPFVDSFEGFDRPWESPPTASHRYPRRRDGRGHRLRRHRPDSLKFVPTPSDRGSAAVPTHRRLFGLGCIEHGQ
jgi:SAM-dependent methyltransferase